MSDIVTSRIFTDGERGITAAKLNDIVGSSVIQPAFYTNKPTAGTADPADIALILKAGAYAQVPISALAGSATQAQIWSTRLRSFNAIGNPNFEVDQRNCSALVSNANGSVIDRWTTYKAGSMQASAKQTGLALALPGISFFVTSTILNATVTTQQASLGSSDQWQWYQQIEGTNFREMAGDVTSLSLLVRSSVAGLKFGVTLTDPSSSKALVKLATIPSANTWVLLQFPNIPLMSGGTFAVGPGQVGYVLHICLAAGPGATVPANDTWQTGNFVGAVGQSNFFASPVNSTFDIGFVQHEPGPVCSTLMDCPFTQNYNDCLRYYSKSYDYGVKAGTVSANGAPSGSGIGAVSPYGFIPFPRPMAKLPNMTAYSPTTGAVNMVRNIGGGADLGVTSVLNPGMSGFSGFGLGSPPAAGYVWTVHYTADTGW